VVLPGALWHSLALGGAPAAACVLWPLRGAPGRSVALLGGILRVPDPSKWQSRARDAPPLIGEWRSVAPLGEILRILDPSKWQSRARDTILLVEKSRLVYAEPLLSKSH